MNRSLIQPQREHLERPPPVPYMPTMLRLLLFAVAAILALGAVVLLLLSIGAGIEDGPSVAAILIAGSIVLFVLAAACVAGATAIERRGTHAGSARLPGA